MGNWKSILLIFVLVMVETIFLTSPCWTADRQEIVIGIINPFSGPAADFGVTAREGVEEAVAELNSAGGVLGRKLKVIYRDDETNPQKGVSAAMELVGGKKVDVIMGGASTPISMAISPIINDAKMIFFTLGTGTPLTDVKKYPYNFRIYYYTDQEAHLIVNYALKRKEFKKVAILTDTSAYGKTGKDSLIKELEAMGVNPVGIEQYNWGDTDMTGQLLKLRQAGAEILLLWGMGQDLAQVARSAQKMGWDIPAIGASGIVQWGFAKLAGDAGENWLGTIFKCVSYTEKEPLSKEVLAWIKKFDEKYGKDRKTAVNTSLLWVDQIKLYVDALKRAGLTDPQKVKIALEATKNFKGINSTYSFRPDKHDGMRIEDLAVVYAASIQAPGIFKRAP